jgi:ketosteroid isomerase-like protein
LPTIYGSTLAEIHLENLEGRILRQALERYRTVCVNHSLGEKEMSEMKMPESEMETKHVQEIMALEQDAMEHWCKGDVEKYLEISADNVTYFDPGTAKRLDGIVELSRHYRSFAGQFHFDRFEFVNPKIEISADFAVLTYNLIVHEDAKAEHWNITNAYRKIRGSWKICHTHASPTQPKIING